MFKNNKEARGQAGFFLCQTFEQEAARLVIQQLENFGVIISSSAFLFSLNEENDSLTMTLSKHFSATSTLRESFLHHRTSLNQQYEKTTTSSLLFFEASTAPQFVQSLAHRVWSGL